MNQKVEGQFILSGLLEGPLPDVEDAESYLDACVEKLRAHGLNCDLSVEGGRFSLLPEQEPVRIEDADVVPAELVREAVENIAANCAGGLSGLTSTLHSSEYRSGTEIQTVYLIQQDGSVEARQREVEAETTPPQRRMSRYEKIKLGLLGLGIALLLAGLSAFFVDYGDFLRAVTHHVSPIKAKKIEVETSAFAPYLNVTGRKIDIAQRALILELKRGDEFPVTEKDRRQLAEWKSDDVSSKLTAETILRGYIRCEVFAEDGDFMKATFCRIKSLRKKETTKIGVPFGTGYRPGKVVLTY